MFKNKHSLPESPLRQNTLKTLFLALLIAGFPHFFNLPIWVTGIFFSCVLLKYYLVSIEKPMAAPYIPILLAIPIISLVYIQFGTLSGIEASISLLVLMLGLKVFELSEYRDAMLSLFLGFFIVVTVFLFQQQLLIVLYLLICGFMLTLSLLKLNDYTGRQPHRQQIKTTFQLSIGSIPIIIILFFIFPRLDSPLWSLPGSNGQGQTGMSESMSPGNFTKLVQSSAPAFRATFNQNTPAQHQLYWRGPVLENFDGKRWSRSNTTKKYSSEKKPLPLTNIGDAFHYQITLEAQHNRWVFPLDIAIDSGKDAITNIAGETLSKEIIRKTSLFEFSSATTFSFDSKARTTGLASALHLPGRTAPKTRALAKKLFLEVGGDNKRFVERVMNRFNEMPYAYTLEPKPMSSDYIDSFMIDTMEGFCEHYSSSFVVMMRAVGIPARVVTGYQGGEYNKNGDYYLIRQSDAHAWTEVWLAGEGWVRKDPTGMVSPERVNQGLESAFAGSNLLPNTIRISFLKKLSMRWDTMNYYWSKWVISYNNTLRSELISRFKSLMGSIGKQLVISLATLALLVFISLILKQLVFSSKNKTSLEETLYRRFITHNKKIYSAVKQDSETEMQYANRLANQNIDQAGLIQTITTIYLGIRYGNKKSDHELQKLRSSISEYCKLSSSPSAEAS